MEVVLQMPIAHPADEWCDRRHHGKTWLAPWSSNNPRNQQMWHKQCQEACAPGAAQANSKPIISYDDLMEMIDRVLDMRMLNLSRVLQGPAGAGGRPADTDGERDMLGVGRHGPRRGRLCGRLAVGGAGQARQVGALHG